MINLKDITKKAADVAAAAKLVIRCTTSGNRRMRIMSMIQLQERCHTLAALMDKAVQKEFMELLKEETEPYE